MKTKESSLEKPTITLSEEWAALSAELCGPEFLKSLGDFFESKQVRTLLECACGDGYVLRGIAGKINSGIGIDSDDYLIKRAQEQNHAPNLVFKKLNILDMDKDRDIANKSFDAVMLRGNGVTSLGAWGTNQETFNSKQCEQMIQIALMKMWDKLGEDGLFYIDVTKQSDIDKGSHTLQIDLGSVHLTGVITIDVDRKRRDVFGHGTVNGKSFHGGSSSYLIGHTELKKLLNELLHPKEIWTPNEISDAMYEVICMRK